MSPNFEFTQEVKQALSQGKPVLALESTLITHGLPYPENIEIAETLENITRDYGVTPATIALMDGKIKIGVTNKDIQRLVKNDNVRKASKRDIPYILSEKLMAGTTVAATLFCAAKAGIRVFATGGIGGVHHGDSLDVSADLIELARSPVAVVCAGAKAILDLPRTLEYLETHGVPIIGYQTNCLPAFYSATTDHILDQHVNHIENLVNIIQTHWQLGMTNGILIANPIVEAHQIPSTVIDPVIESALVAAQSENIRGKDVTPYLLKEISKATAGKSVQANLHLIKNNVELGAKIAAAL